MIRPCTKQDAAEICGIYNLHVLKTIVTFEIEPVSEADMAGRIETVMQTHPWFVFVDGGKVMGYTYARQFRERAAYKHSAESSIFVAEDAGRRGIGRALYGALFKALKPLGIHMVIGGVSLPNEGSVGLHEAMGFTKVAHFPEVGRKFDRWIDVGYWARKLD